MITFANTTQPSPSVHRRAAGLADRFCRRIRQIVNRLRPVAAVTGEGTEPLFWERDAAYAIGLAAVRQREWALAERELTNGNGPLALSDARCLNLLGIVYESTGRWSLARSCYSRAARSDRRFQAPLINLKRHHELSTLGRTRIAICLGEEKGVLS